MSVPLWVLQSLWGAFIVQALAFIGWCIRCEIRLNGVLQSQRDMDRDLQGLDARCAVDRGDLAKAFNRLTATETKLDNVSATLTRIEGKTDKMGDKLDRILEKR